MEYVYAAMLLHKAGKDITEDNVTAVVEAAGLEADESQVKALVAALEGVDIEESIANAVVSAPASAPADTTAGGEEAPAEEAEEEDEEDEEAAEEEAAAGLGSLFG
jgi:large subunit ribosomal protein L12